MQRGSALTLGGRHFRTLDIRGGALTQGVFTTRNAGTATVLTIEGEVDIGNVSELAGVFEAVFAAGAGPLVVSLGGARYFDSSTIHTFAQVLTRAQETRRHVSFAVPPGSPAEAILRAAGFVLGLVAFPSEEAALEAAAS